MALINCDECNKEVSDKAETCPQCGAPIANALETKAAGSQIKTIQETSKKFKLHSIISGALFIIGTAWMTQLGDTPPGSTGSSLIAGLIAFSLMVIGFLWFIINQLRIWWHHK